MNLRIFSICALATVCSLPALSGRTWVNSSGQPMKGTFVGLKSGSVKIRLDADQKVVSVPLKVLSKADQDFVRTREMTAKADLVALAVKRIDAAVDAGLEKKKLKYNESLNDHMYLRRIYLDLAGRIPSYDEAKAFLGSRSKNKRQELEDMFCLFDADGSGEVRVYAHTPEAHKDMHTDRDIRTDRHTHRNTQGHRDRQR